MSTELTNELEERRVVRLLAGAADALSPLPDAEVATMLRRARAGQPARRRSTGRLHVFSTAAVAAAAALAVSLPLGGGPSERPAGASPSAAAGLVAFPEGSALQLLLSRGDAEHA